MKEAESYQSKVQVRRCRGELGALAEGLTHRLQSVDSVPTGSGEPWEVFSREVPWPALSAMPCGHICTKA